MKNIEEKFEEFIKNNSMNRMYMSDYIKAGYAMALDEIQDEIVGILQDGHDRTVVESLEKLLKRLNER